MERTSVFDNRAKAFSSPTGVAHSIKGMAGNLNSGVFFVMNASLRRANIHGEAVATNEAKHSLCFGQQGGWDSDNY